MNQWTEYSKPERTAGWALLLLVGLFLVISNQVVLLHALPNWYDQQRFLSLLLLALALIIYSLWPVYRPSPVAALLIGGALYLSATSPLPGWALAEMALFMGMVTLATRLGTTLRYLQQEKPSLVLRGLIIYATLISLPPLMQYGLRLSSHEDFNLASLFSGFSNHRFFSQVESLLLPLLALPAMLLDTSSRWRRLGNVAACLLWLLAFAAGTRAFYVAILAGSAWAFFACAHTGRQWLRWQIRFAVIGGLGFALLFSMLPAILGFNIVSDNARLHSLESSFNSSGRLDMWLASIPLILEHPLTGIGPMHFATLAISANSPGFAAHPHNAVIQLLVEWGLLFGGLLLALLLMGFLRFKRIAFRPSGNPSVNTLAQTLTITLITAGVYSLFDGSIVTPYTQILLALIIGVAWSLMPEPHIIKPNQQSTTRWFSQIIVRSSCLMAGVFLIWLAIYPYGQLTPHVADYIQAHSDKSLYPRLWSQGLINLPEDQRYPGLWFKKL